MKIKICPISGSKGSVEYINLGNIPLVNNLCSTQEEALSCERFPLAVQFFPESKVTCLTEIINKDNLFLNYLYQSGVNKPYLEHCVEMYDYLSHIINFKDNDLVVDIGGNDGSLLKEFRKENRNLHYVNVDCSTSFIDINREAGIEYVNEYFGENTTLPYKAKLITSTNVFQHTEPIVSFVKGVKKIFQAMECGVLNFHISLLPLQMIIMTRYTTSMYIIFVFKILSIWWKKKG